MILEKKAKVIEESLSDLIEYIENENYSGWDPYDALKSPIFKITPFRKFHYLRFACQQFLKRFPINIRPLLLIHKGYNPVTLGLCIQGYSYLYNKDDKKTKELLLKIDKLIIELKKLIPTGYSGACWGYDFDWAARRASIPAYQPTVVATGIITNALFECYRITGNVEAINLCISASDFVLKDLHRTYEKDVFCFSYSPFDYQQVYNANMKGARLLSQVYSITKDESIKKSAKLAVDYVVNKQNSDGSWFYASNKASKWVDNYHTGYILDCLEEYINCTGDETYKENLNKGFIYYENSFFENGYKPKFYNQSLYPLDCTAAGQSLLTLCRFGKGSKANQVAEYVIGEMQSKVGYFYFRKYKYYTKKTSYMRWSNAWMMVGLSFLTSKEVK